MQINTEKVESVIRARGLKRIWIANEMGANPGTLRRALKVGYASRMTVKLLADALGLSEEEIAA